MDVFSAPPGELPSAGNAPDEVARYVTQAASHAPSVYDSAPWWFSAADGGICVRADVERRLPASDPAGRELTISCGAAIFTARIALRCIGLIPDVHVFPEPQVPNLVAKITWPAEHKEPGDFERELYAQIPVKGAYQGGLDGARLPSGLMSSLAGEAAAENAALRFLTDDDHRGVLVALLDAASRAFRLDGARVAEASTATRASGDWGAPPADASVSPRSAGIVAILTTDADDRADWVAAGQALQRVLLAASSRRVSVAIDSQPVEFSQLRGFIGSVLAGGAYPQLILRFGQPVPTT
jgi:hypothetical protein